MRRRNLGPERLGALRGSAKPGGMGPSPRSDRLPPVSPIPCFDPASDRDVSLYDELPLWSALAGELLLESVTLAGARRVLDLGCGAGFPLLELAERLGRSAFVAGLDPWAEALRRARARVVRWSAGNAAVVRGDGGA